MTGNPVIRGYRWSQQFECPPGTLQPFDELEAEIYYQSQSPYLKNMLQRLLELTTASGGIAFSDQIIQVDIDAEWTKNLRGGVCLTLDFKRIRDGEEVYLGVKATFPIREPLTKGKFG